MMDQDLENQYPDLNNILFNASLASLLVCEKDPISYLNYDPELRDIQHELEEICLSRDYTEKNVYFFNKLSEIKYMIAKNETKKRIIVAFRVLANLDDLEVDIENYPKISDDDGCLQSCFYKQAEHVPIDYFIDKFIEGYELIFTGYSSGGIMAAMITIKLLTMLDLSPENSRKITFVGYGCPSVSHMYFKRNFDIKFNDRFIFLKNQDDIRVEILDNLCNFVYDETRTKQSKKIISDYFSVNKCNFNDYNLIDYNDSEVKNNLLRSLLNQYFITINKTKNEKQLGINLKIDDQNNIVKDKLKEKLIKIRNIFEQLKINTDCLLNIINDEEKNQNCFIKGYLLNLKQGILKSKCNLFENETQKVTIFNDLFNISRTIKDMIIAKNENNITIYLSIEMDFFEYLVAVRIVFKTSNNKPESEKLESKFSQNCTMQPVDGSNSKFHVDTKEKETNGTFKFTCPTSLVLDKNGKINQFRIKLYSHFSQDPIEIEVNDEILKSVKITDESTYKYVQIQDMPFDLLYVNAAVYIHLITRMQVKEENNQINYKFVQAKDELLELFDKIDHFAQVKVNHIEQDELASLLKSYLKYQISDHEEKNEDFQEFIKNIKFKCADKGLKKIIYESINNENSSNELLTQFVINLNEIKKKMSSIGKNSDHILENFVLKDNRIWEKFKKYANFLELKKILPALTTKAAQAKIPFAKYIAKKYKKNQLKKENENFLYKQIVELVPERHSRLEKYLGEFEKRFTDEFIRCWKNESDKKIFKIIQINSRIREILCRNFLIGVIGTKKTGKSTFVELITGKYANSSATDATIVATPYILSDQICLVDYPHINSSTISHKIEFIFSRLLLDHVIMIFDAKLKGQTKEEKLLLNQVSRNDFQNYTILYNNSDFVIKERKQNLEDNFKTEICNSLETSYRDKIHFTCMIKSIDNLREIDSLIDCSVVLRSELIAKFNQILSKILKINTDNNNGIQIFRIMEKKEISKKISINYNDTTMSYTLHLDKNFIKKENDFRNFADFDSLSEEIKYYFRLRSEFTIQSYDNKQMQSIEDFFNHKYHCFQLVLNN